MHARLHTLEMPLTRSGIWSLWVLQVKKATARRVEGVSYYHVGSMIPANAGVPPTTTAPTPEASVPATVTIVVKNVYRNTTIELALPVTEALSSVKKAIREQFDEHPAPDQQRLIYLGKVCSNDSVPLKDLLSQSRVGGVCLCGSGLRHNNGIAARGCSIRRWEP